HVGRKVDTRDAYIPSSIWRVYYHSGGRAVTIGIPMDRPVVAGSIHTVDWRVACRKLLGLIIGGILMPNKSRNLIHLRWLLKLVNFREAANSVGGLLVGDFVSGDVSSLNDVHTIDLWGWTDENWSIFHVQYINIWDNMYEFLTTREAIIALKLACNLDYMSWFRIHSKLYLAGPSSAPMQETAPIVAPSMVAPPTSQYVPSYSDAYTNPFIFTLNHIFSLLLLCQVLFSDLLPRCITRHAIYISNNDDADDEYRPSMYQAPTKSPVAMLSVYGTQHSCTHMWFMLQTPPRSLFYQGGSSSQPPILRLEDT
ncbi:hypothetical protein Goari_014219, partial [Gossypium aridum]|nr:hypothetical protein [Gossypium aridum]